MMSVPVIRKKAPGPVRPLAKQSFNRTPISIGFGPVAFSQIEALALTANVSFAEMVRRLCGEALGRRGIS